jgi:outer membrane protein assembly factor BamB
MKTPLLLNRIGTMNRIGARTAESASSSEGVRADMAVRVPGRFMARSLGFELVSLAAFLISVTSNAEEWLQYRGPNHDGIVTENIRLNWSQEPPRQIWKVPLEDALSSFTIGGGRAFTQARRPGNGLDQEYCIALDAGTGQELWATRLDVADYDSGAGEGDGPRSTPSVDGDRVYILTSHLKMACLEAATGQVVWNKDLVSEFGGRVITWQNAASPLIVGDLIFLNGNAPNQRLMALRKQDGTVAWKRHNDAMTQSTPVAATIADVPQVIFFAQSGLVSVAPETGEVLWRYPFPYSTSTASSPVVANDVVYCSAAYGMGAGAVRVTKNGDGLAATEIWRTPGDNMNHWATPVHHEGFLYGNYGHSLVNLRCIDLATGVDKWRQNGVGRGGVLFVSGHILALAEDGDLILVKPDPSSYSEVARFKAVRGKCWNVPAISGGRIYVRSTSEAVCLDVSIATKPLPRLKFYPTFARTGDSFSLLLGNEDDSPLELSRLAKIDIFATSDLATGFSGWVRLSNAGVLTNGQLRLDAQSSTELQRFFRALERP